MEEELICTLRRDNYCTSRMEDGSCGLKYYSQYARCDYSVESGSGKEKKIFDHWNEVSPIKHRKLTDGMRKNIKIKLIEYGEDNLIKCIDNYVSVVTDETCWYGYKSALDDFFRPGKQKPAPCMKFLPERFVKDNFKIKNGREVEERRPQKKAFTTIQCSVWPYFPDGHDYRYFPADSDEDKWTEIHDRIMCHDKHDDRIAEAKIIAKELEGGK